MMYFDFLTWSQYWKTALKYILIIIVLTASLKLLITFYSLNELFVLLEKCNNYLLDFSEWNDAITLYLFYLLIIFVFTVLWDWFWGLISDWTRDTYLWIIRPLIQLDKVEILIRLVRIYFDLRRFYSYIRFNWVKTRSFYHDEDRYIYQTITSPRWSAYLVQFIKMFVSIASIVAMLLVCLIHYDLISIIKTYYYSIMGIKITVIKNIWEQVLPKIPAIITLLGIFIVIRLVSTKGVLRRAIASSNKKNLEEAINTHRNLTNTIYSMLFKGSDNIRYILLNRKSIARTWTYNRHQKIDILHGVLKEMYSYQEGNIEKYQRHLKDITEISRVVEIMSHAQKQNLYSSIRYFMIISSDLYGGRKFLESKLEENLYGRLFTPRGFLEHLNVGAVHNMAEWEANNGKFEEAKRHIRKDEEWFLELFDREIVKSIEYMYSLHLYASKTYKLTLINGDSFGRFIRNITGKEN